MLGPGRTAVRLGRWLVTAAPTAGAGTPWKPTANKAVVAPTAAALFPLNPTVDATLAAPHRTLIVVQRSARGLPRIERARSSSQPFPRPCTPRLVSAGACAPRRSQSATQRARTRRAPPRTGRVCATDRRGRRAVGGR